MDNFTAKFSKNWIFLLKWCFRVLKMICNRFYMWKKI